MKTFKLDNAQEYFDIYELTGYSPGTSLIVMNNTGGQIRLSQSETKPSVNNIGFPVWPNDTALMHGNNVFSGWIKGGTDGYIIVQELSGTIMPLTAVELPQDIITSSAENFRRLQVEDQRTAFFEGREFRTIQKIRLGSGESIIYKIFCSEPFILEELQFTISEGNYEVHVWDAGNVTEDTPFTVVDVNLFAKNLSDDIREFDGARYESVMDIKSGGTITVTNPLLYREYLEMKTASSTAQRSALLQGSNSQRYLPANIAFYIEIENIDNSAVRGTLAAAWEERPPNIIK